MVRIETIQKELSILLNKKIINGKVLLQNCKFIDENSRKTPAYGDYMYAPFYYHLGKFVKPKNVFSWNFTLGFLEKCFFMSCKETETFFSFRKKDENLYFSPRMGSYNVKKSFKKEFDFYHGSIHDDEINDKITSQKWDCFFITDENSYDDLLYYLDISWKNMADDGIIVVEYIKDLKKMKNAFYAFAESVEKEPIIYNTRYGTGILQK